MTWESKVRGFVFSPFLTSPSISQTSTTLTSVYIFNVFIFLRSSSFSIWRLSSFSCPYMTFSNGNYITGNWRHSYQFIHPPLPNMQYKLCHGTKNRKYCRRKIVINFEWILRYPIVKACTRNWIFQGCLIQILKLQNQEIRKGLFSGCFEIC